MSSTIFFFIFIPFLAFVLLLVNLVFAPNNPYQEKESAFECGFHSFLGQNRTQFSISFFIFALLFLLFDLEILLVYPYIVSAYSNNLYGLLIMLVFFTALTIGLGYELGKKALNIDSRQKLSKSFYKKPSTIFIPNSRRDITYTNLNNIKVNESYFASMLVNIFLYIFLYIYFFLLVFLYTMLLDMILLSKYFKNYIPYNSLFSINNKTSIINRIKFMFTREYLIIIIPTTIFILTINLIYIYLNGHSILNMSSSYLTIYIYTLIISIFFNLFFCYVTKRKFFSKSNIFNLFYISIIMFFSRITIFKTLPVLLPFLFIYVEKHVITEHISKLNSNIIKFVKGFLCHIPILNKFSIFFYEKGSSFINRDIHKQIYTNIIPYKSKLFIAKPRLSITLNLTSINNRAEILQINSMLSCEIFKSFIIVFNKLHNFSVVYSLTVNNYNILDTSIVHIKKVGVLMNYFSNSKVNFLNITSLKSSFIKLERNTFILHPGNLKFSNPNLTQDLRCILFKNSSNNNYSLIQSPGYVYKAIIDNHFNFTDVFLKKNSCSEFPFNSKSAYVNNIPYICDKNNDYMSISIDKVTSNIPYEMLNPIVFMMNNNDINAIPKDKGKGVVSIQDSYLPDAKSLERAFKEYKGWDEGNVFELVSEQAEYLSVCLFFNDLDRVSFALNSAEKNKNYLIHNEELRKAFYELIEPLVSQYISFFDEQDGDIHHCIESLSDLFTYLMTDEYKEMSAYIDKLGEELGVKFVEDIDMLWTDDFRYRVLVRENLHSFFMRTETHFRHVLQKDQSEGETDILEENELEIRKKKRSLAAKRYREKNREKIAAHRRIYYENVEKPKRQKKN